MSLALALALALLTAPACAQTRKGKPEPSLPRSVIPESARAPGAGPAGEPDTVGKPIDGARRSEVPVIGESRPVGPGTAPAEKGRRGPVEPEPTLDPEILAAPTPVDPELFSKLVTHVRKHCSEGEGGLCCLSGQAPLKKGAPARTACLEIGTPVEEGDVHHAVYREVFTGLTLVTTESLPKEKRVEQTVLEMGMGGSVDRVAIESEADAGDKSHRANALKPGEAEKLFTDAAKDLLTITPRIRI